MVQGALMQDRIDTYDERGLFSTRYALVAAYPRPEAIAAVLPAGPRDLAPLAAGFAIRRRRGESWGRDTVAVVRIPDELLEAHAAEVIDVTTHPPLAARQFARTYPTAPVEEYRVAWLGLVRGRIQIDPVTWASAVAHAEERSVVLLAEHTRDWAPWVPMINFAAKLRKLDGTDTVLRAAEHRLRLIARRLLDAQGFTGVRVDDTLGNPLVMQAAIASVCGRESTPP